MSREPITDFQKNRGVYIEPKKEDWHIKGISGLVYRIVNKLGNWGSWLPSAEKQNNWGGDAMDCVSGASIHACDTEIQFNQLINNGSLELGFIDWSKEQGFIDGNGKFNSSQRFLAKMSGTNKNGNSPNKVANALKNFGILPEKDWTWDWENHKFNWNEFYAEIPQALKDKAKRILRFVDIQYEWVADGGQPTLMELQYHLKQAPLILAAPTCPPWGGGIIPACFDPACHCTMIFNATSQYTEIFDTYYPYRKKLAPNYPLKYVMKIVIVPKTFEITREQAQYIYSIRKDVADAFSADRRFVSLEDPNYNIYSWCKRYGIYQNYEVFVNKDGKTNTEFDWSKADGGRKSEAQWLEPPTKEVKKKPFFEKVAAFLRLIFKLRI